MVGVSFRVGLGLVFGLGFVLNANRAVPAHIPLHALLLHSAMHPHTILHALLENTIRHEHSTLHAHSSLHALLADITLHAHSTLHALLEWLGSVFTVRLSVDVWLGLGVRLAFRFGVDVRVYVAVCPA